MPQAQPSKRGEGILCRYGKNECRFALYGSTCYLNLHWYEGKMGSKAYKAILEVFEDSLSKLKLLGVTRVLSAVDADDEKAIKFNALFGLSPVAEVREPKHLFICQLELK